MAGKRSIRRSCRKETRVKRVIKAWPRSSTLLLNVHWLTDRINLFIGLSWLRRSYHIDGIQRGLAPSPPKNLAINAKSFLFRYVRRKTDDNEQKRDESGLKAVKRVLCRRQAVTYRHTCEPARKGFSREIRRKRSPMRKMPEESFSYMRPVSWMPFIFSAPWTHLYSYLAVLLDYHVCVQALMVLRRYKRCERKTTRLHFL